MHNITGNTQYYWQCTFQREIQVYSLDTKILIFFKPLQKTVTKSIIRPTLVTGSWNKNDTLNQPLSHSF